MGVPKHGISSLTLDEVRLKALKSIAGIHCRILVLAITATK